MGMLGVIFCLVYLQSINYFSVLKSSIFSIFSGSYHLKYQAKIYTFSLFHPKQ